MTQPKFQLLPIEIFAEKIGNTFPSGKQREHDPIFARLLDAKFHGWTVQLDEFSTQGDNIDFSVEVVLVPRTVSEEDIDKNFDDLANYLQTIFIEIIEAQMKANHENQEVDLDNLEKE